MKKHLLTALLCFTAMMAFHTKSNAQTLIHYWHFNNFTGTYYTPTIDAIPADYTDLPGTNARVLYAEMSGVSSSYSTYIDSGSAVTADFDTVNARQSQPSGYYIKARNPSDSMYLVFFIPSAGFTNLILKYGTESSSTTHGMDQQVYSYSVDSGVNWITSGGLSTQEFSMDTINGTTDTFRLATVSITDTAAYNNRQLVFRIAFVGKNTGTSGNNRFDNITLDGDTCSTCTPRNYAIPNSVASIVNPSQRYTLYPNPVVNIMDVNGTSAGVKSVTIYNELGERVYSGSKEGKSFSINTSALSPGNYYLNIHETDAGDVSTIKFVKK